MLRQATDIQRYMSTLPPNFDGASEWTRWPQAWESWPRIYGTTLPLPDGQQARRMNDGELKKAAEDVAKGADQFKKDLDSSLKMDKTIDVATREASVKEADGLKQDAKKLASAVGDGKPASGEAKALLDSAARMRTSTSGRPLSPAAQTAWESVEGGLGKVAFAFGLPAKLP